MSHECPDEERLAAYFDGLLGPAEEQAFHAELSTCADCMQFAAALGLVIEADAGLSALPSVPPAVTARAQDLWRPSPLRLAARWIDGQLSAVADAMRPVLQPALSVRGSSSTAHVDTLTYQLRLGPLEFEVDLEVDGPDQISLTARPLAPPPAGAMLRVTSDGETRALSSLTPSGTTIPALLPGHYALHLESGSAALGTISIDLEPPI